MDLWGEGDKQTTAWEEGGSTQGDGSWQVGRQTILGPRRGPKEEQRREAKVGAVRAKETRARAPLTFGSPKPQHWPRGDG